MKKRMGVLVLLLGAAVAWAEESGSIRLPEPDRKGGMPLMQALAQRRTTRAFSAKPLPLQTLSELLWAAFGVNRAETGGRTAPSAMDAREIDVYVALETGLYRYDAPKNSLELVAPEDIRAMTGTQAFVRDAPADLVYVADLSRAKRFGGRKDLLSSADAGYISENVYLYCASSGLVTGVRASFDESKLAKAMKLKPEQKIILAQSVGYPK